MYNRSSSRLGADILARRVNLWRDSSSAVTAEIAQLGPDFALNPGWINNIRQSGSIPSLRHLHAISVHMKLTFGGVLRIFDIDLDDLVRYEEMLNADRTRLVETYPFDRDRLVQVPSALAATAHFDRTAYIADLVQSWQRVPIRALRGSYWQREGFLYGKLGIADRMAWPVIPPGSYLQIAPLPNPVTSLAPRAFYFLQHAKGYFCCRCSLKEGWLDLITNDSEYTGPFRFRYGHEVRAVGRITAFATSLPLRTGHAAPRKNVHLEAPLILPWEHQHISDLVACERKRFGLTSNDIAAASARLAEFPWFDVSSRTAFRLEQQQHFPQTGTVLALSPILSLRFTDVLKSIGVTLDDSARLSLETLRSARAPGQLPTEFRSQIRRFQ